MGSDIFERIFMNPIKKLVHPIGRASWSIRMWVVEFFFPTNTLIEIRGRPMIKRDGASKKLKKFTLLLLFSMLIDNGIQLLRLENNNS